MALTNFVFQADPKKCRLRSANDVTSVARQYTGFPGRVRGSVVKVVFWERFLTRVNNIDLNSDSGSNS